MIFRQNRRLMTGINQNHPVRLTPATPPWRGIRQKFPVCFLIPLRGGVPTTSAGWFNTHNDFAELIFSQNKDIKSIKDMMISNHAAAANLTGSGSALFGIFGELSNAKKCRDALNLKSGVEFCDIFDFLC